MAELAKLRLRKRRSWRIWESLVSYANAHDDRSRAASKEQDVQALFSNCMDWVGGDKDDIAECRDMRDGSSMTDLAIRYRSDIRRVLTWLADPVQHTELSPRAARFLSVYGTGIRMDVSANPVFEGKDVDEPLLLEWPGPCESVIAPVCKFILEQIERHDIGGEPLREVVPIGLCGRSGCHRFFLIERAGRGRFCSDKCRAGAYQDSLTKEQKAARMRKYRRTVDEFRRKPIRFAKKESRK